MPLAEIPQDLALMLVTGSWAIWLGPVDRTKDRLRRGELAVSCPAVSRALREPHVSPGTLRGTPQSFLQSSLWVT